MKDPQFYCENCGNPVSLRADSCPTCGRRFEAVKCPECGFSGKAALFSDGCPSCGYLSSLTSISGESLPGLDEADPGSKAGGSGGRRPRQAEAKQVLPPWAYTAITLGLIGFLIFLFVTYLTMD